MVERKYCGWVMSFYVYNIRLGCQDRMWHWRGVDVFGPEGVATMNIMGLRTSLWLPMKAILQAITVQSLYFITKAISDQKWCISPGAAKPFTKLMTRVGPPRPVTLKDKNKDYDRFSVR